MDKSPKHSDAANVTTIPSEEVVAADMEAALQSILYPPSARSGSENHPSTATQGSGNLLSSMNRSGSNQTSLGGTATLTSWQSDLQSTLQTLGFLEKRTERALILYPDSHRLRKVLHDTQSAIAQTYFRLHRIPRLLDSLVVHCVTQRPANPVETMLQLVNAALEEQQPPETTE